MKGKIFCLALVLSLCLSGCSLARPEKEKDYEDVFCGFYAVAEQMDAEGQIKSGFYENPNLEVYGSESMNLDGIGNVAFDREVLFGVTDEAGNVTFPGMKKGYRLLLYTYNENGYPVSAVQSDMGPGEEGTQIKHTDEGAYMSTSGVIYLGPPLGAGPDWSEQDTGTIWTLYRVYQTRDGRFYMDGSGNSYGGAGGMTVNEDQTYRSTRNGETEEETTVSITVEVRQVERLERLTVYQHGTDGALLGTEDVALSDPMPEFRCAAGTAWVVVEESYANGSRKHTAYDLGEEDISHGVVLLDDAGCGSYASLSILK